MSRYVLPVSALGTVVGGAVLLKDYVAGGACPSKATIHGKTVIVTGANTGIGKQTALELAKRGGNIILACRDMEKCEAAAKDIRRETLNHHVNARHLDLASLKSIREFAAKIIAEEERVDILVNNAAVMRCPHWTTEDGFEMQFGVNHLAYHQIRSHFEVLEVRIPTYWIDMGRNQRRNSGNMKNQKENTPPKRSTSPLETDTNPNQATKMTEEEFRMWIIRTLTELQQQLNNQHKQTTKSLQDMEKEMDTMKKSLTELLEMKNQFKELQNTVESLKNRVDQTEERISELEDNTLQLNKSVTEIQQRNKRKEQSLQELWDYVKKPNVRVIGLPEGEEDNTQELDKLFEDIIEENFPGLAQNLDIQVQEAQRTPGRFNANRKTSRHAVIRLTKVSTKEALLRAVRQKKQVTYKGKPIRITPDFSNETLQARRDWGPILTLLKQNNAHPRILFPAKLSFLYEGEIKTFSDKQSLREFTKTRPALQEVLKTVLRTEHHNKNS
ncbi:retinol dehydrogenase 13 isoform X1 [Microcebus murinus]|uniref:retinol dehydrogenase 13 isoform X1 n=1 Tax=Microcebus murinus TaxID=30608 RepID=UPI003F6CA81E